MDGAANTIENGPVKEEKAVAHEPHVTRTSPWSSDGGLAVVRVKPLAAEEGGAASLAAAQQQGKGNHKELRTAGTSPAARPVGAGTATGVVSEEHEDRGSDVKADDVAAPASFLVDAEELQRQQDVSSSLTVHGRTFDYPQFVFQGTSATQQVVYEQFMPRRIEDFFYRGKNCNIIAYGQTGSGKTHTMFGPPGMMGKAGKADFDLTGFLTPPASSPARETTKNNKTTPALHNNLGPEQQNLWLCPRGILEIFRLVQQEKRGRKLVLTGSAVELTAMDGNLDLLLKQKRKAADGAMFGRFTGASGVSLDRTCRPSRLCGMTQIFLDTLDDIKVLFSAISTRNTSATGLNSTSSRSHCFVFLWLYELVDEINQNGSCRTAQTSSVSTSSSTGSTTTKPFLASSRFQFVDLAGSERLEEAHDGNANWRTGVAGVIEGWLTNYSLMMLSSCVRELAQTKPEKRKNFSLRLFMVDVVFLLEESSLNSDPNSESKTLMIVCMSAAEKNSQQSRFALEFGETFASLSLRKNRVGDHGASSSRLEEDGTLFVNEAIQKAEVLEVVRKKHLKIFEENKANLPVLEDGIFAGKKHNRYVMVRAALAKDAKFMLEVIDRITTGGGGGEAAGAASSSGAGNTSGSLNGITVKNAGSAASNECVAEQALSSKHIMESEAEMSKNVENSSSIIAVPSYAQAEARD
ncbi:unnamed protein product, partial [Amoebophrya sp. A120]|eukprot:GSA120T00024328001.1